MGASHHKQHASESQELPTSDELPSASSPADASDTPADASETILQNPVRVTILTAGFLLPILTEMIMHMVHGTDWYVSQCRCSGLSMLFNSATRAVSFLSATLPSVLLLALLLLALLASVVMVVFFSS